MNVTSQNKVMAVGFVIIRKDDYPQPRIKQRSGNNGAWKTLEKYLTKAERDRAFETLLKEDKYIED